MRIFILLLAASLATAEHFHHPHYDNCENPWRYALTCADDFHEMPTGCYARSEHEGELEHAIRFCTRYDDNSSRPIAVEDIQHFYYGSSIKCKHLGDGPYFVNAILNHDGYWRRYNDRNKAVDFKSFEGHVERDCEKGEGLVWYPGEGGSERHPHMGALRCSKIEAEHKALCYSQLHQKHFDLENDNAIFYAERTLYYGQYSDNKLRSCAVTALLRMRLLDAVAVFDALTHYYEHSKPVVLKEHHKVHDHERSRKNKNIAVLYAYTVITRSILPEYMAEGGPFREALLKVGLNPDATLEHPGSEAAHIGLKAGQAVMDFAIDDAFNQRGYRPHHNYNRKPYLDWTGFFTYNTAYNLTDPIRWQPQFRLLPGKIGEYYIQQFLTPQLTHEGPISYSNPSQFTYPNHGRMGGPNSADYKKWCDESIAISSNLTDNDKIISELYIEKMDVIPTSLEFRLHDWNIMKVATIQMASAMAIVDASIPVWIAKAYYNAIRPDTAVPLLYKDTIIHAWGGPGKGTVEMLGSDYAPYLPTPNHPEYPSASTTICTAHADIMRKFTGSDHLNWELTWLQGSSYIEPGHVPSRKTVYEVKTWTQFAKDCAWSRVVCGAHFSDSMLVAFDNAHAIARLVIEFVEQHVDFDKI